MNEAKGVPILISLDARFTTEGQEEDSMRLITTGELEKNADGYVIRYEESIDEDSAAASGRNRHAGRTLSP